MYSKTILFSWIFVFKKNFYIVIFKLQKQIEGFVLVAKYLPNPTL